MTNALIAACALALVAGCGEAQSGTIDGAAGVADAATPTPDASAGGDANADAMVPAADAAGADFTISTAASHIDLRNSQSTTLAITIARGTNFTTSVLVSAKGLPTGVSAAPITFAPGQTQATMTFQASGASAGATATVTLLATAGSLTHTATVDLLVLGDPGTRDVTFGTNGALDLSSILGGSALPSLVPLGDGRIVLVTHQSGQIVAVALNGDGSVDTSFGDASTGTEKVDFSATIPTLDRAVGELQSDGKIVLIGEGDADPSSSVDDDIVLARLTAGGTLDTTFAGGGKKEFAFGTDNTSLAHATLDSSDRILVAGFDSGKGTYIARFTADGALDTFGSNGIVVNNTVGDPVLGIGLDGGGNIYLSASTGGFATTSELSRFSDAGVLDSAYGVNQVSTTPSAVAVLSSGDVLFTDSLAGKLDLIGTDGQPNPSFADSGVLTISGASDMTALILTPDGKALAGGETSPLSGGHPLFVRLQDPSAGILDASFGQSGIAVDPAPFSTNTAARPQSIALRTPHRFMATFLKSGAPTLVQYWY